MQVKMAYNKARTSFVLLIISFTFSWNLLFSQNSSEIDTDLRDTKEKLELIISDGGRLLYSDPDSLLKLASFAEKLGRELNDWRGHTIAENFRASILGKSGEVDSAISVLKRNLEYIKENDRASNMFANTFNLISIQYYRNSQDLLHLLYNDSAIIIARKLELVGMELTLLYNRAHVMSDLGYPTVTDSLLKYLLNHKDIDNYLGLKGSILIGISTNFMTSNESDSIKKYATLGLEAANLAKEERQISDALYFLARSDYLEGHYESALAKLTKADSTFIKLDNASGIEKSTLLRAEILNKMHKSVAAKNLLLKLSTPSNGERNFKPRISKLLSEIYNDLGLMDSAYYFIMNYQIAKDEQNREDLNKKIIQLEFKHATKERHRELIIVRNEKKLIEQKNLISTLVGLFIVIVLLFTLATLRYRYRQKIIVKEKEQEILKKEISQKTEQKELRERQLSMKALHLVEKKELIDNLINLVKNSYSEGIDKILGDFDRKLKLSSSAEKDLLTFQKTFEEINPTFYSNLEKSNIGFTENEKRLLAFFKLGLSNREISNILYVEAKSIKVARYRLNKKLLNTNNTSLADFIQSL